VVTGLLEEDGMFGEIERLSTFGGEQLKSDGGLGQGKYCMAGVKWKGECSSLVEGDDLKGKCVS
jgi:hypothetical protein